MLKVPIFYSILLVLIVAVSLAVALSFFYQKITLEKFIEGIERKHLSEASEKIKDIIGYQTKQLKDISSLMEYNSIISNYFKGIKNEKEIANLQASLNLDVFLIIDVSGKVLLNYSDIEDNIVNSISAVGGSENTNVEITSMVIFVDDFIFIIISPIKVDDVLQGWTVIGKRITGSFVYEISNMFHADISIFSLLGDSVNLIDFYRYQDNNTVMNMYLEKGTEEEIFIYSRDGNALSLVSPFRMDSERFFLVVTENFQDSLKIITSNKDTIFTLLLISAIIILLMSSIYTYYVFKPLRSLAIRSKNLVDNFNYYFYQGRGKFKKYNEMESIIKIIDFATETLSNQTMVAKKEKEEAIHHAETRTQFIANMSHEIRTPLNGIIGMTEVLQNSEVTPEQARCVGIIKNNSDALMAIIDDILDLTKIENNLGSFGFPVVNPNILCFT